MFETLVGTSTLHLKVVQVAPEPPPVFEHQVPVFTSEFTPTKQEYWDLTTKQVPPFLQILMKYLKIMILFCDIFQVLPYIDGRSHVARIATEADVDVGLVKACIQNLL